MESKQDGILGIENRTENWKTAQLIQGLCDPGKVALARRLGEPDGTQADDIRIELFWYGVRDGRPDLDGGSAEVYNQCFANLRQDIRDFRTPQNRGMTLQDHNYVVSQETKARFFRNLQNTEIDIVLETPERLFVGEAKHESGLGRDGKLVLVHQLIRQYVTVTILLDLLCKKKKVVPFVVANADKLESVKKTAQVNFMVCQGWLKSDNVLSWCKIDAIKRAHCKKDCNC